MNCCRLLPLLILAAMARGQSPVDAPPAGTLEETRRAALNYSRSLPDFICSEFIHRYEAEGPTGAFHITDTLTLQLTYFQLQENYKLVAHNNRPTKLTLEKLGGASSEGDFGSKLLLIFHPLSKTHFAFEEWSSIGDRRVAVYTYRVERANSRFEMRVGTQSVFAGYHGKVYVEDATRLVLRIFEVIDIPDRFPVQFSYNNTDYDFVDVAGRQYLLPVRCETFSADLPPPKLTTGRVSGFGPLLTEQKRYRNVIEFRDYRKYAAESTLTFDAPGPPKY